VYRGDDGQLLVRLFNAEGDATPRRIKLDERVRRVELVELDGRVVRELPIDRAAGGGTVSIAMPRFGVRTLRCTTAG
jgi:alpha-mannosidase